MVAKRSEGALGTPFTMEIERGKVAEFARAVHAEHPDHFREEGATAPATFLETRRFWEEGVLGADPWALVEMDPRRGLHAEQEFVFHGPPPRAGDRLQVQSRIDRIYEKEGRRGGTLTFAVMVTEFRDTKGQLVAEAILTGVETAKPPEEDA